MKIVLLSYPRCSTCKKALTFLKGLTSEPIIVRNIAEEPPTVEELKTWLVLSHLPLKKFFNTSGNVYKTLGLKDKLGDMSEGEALALLASDGMLVKRPILLVEDTVTVGFKEEVYQALF